MVIASAQGITSKMEHAWLMHYFEEQGKDEDQNRFQGKHEDKSMDGQVADPRGLHISAASHTTHEWLQHPIAPFPPEAPSGPMGPPVALRGSP